MAKYKRPSIDDLEKELRDLDREWTAIMEEAEHGRVSQLIASMVISKYMKTCLSIDRLKRDVKRKKRYDRDKNSSQDGV